MNITGPKVSVTILILFVGLDAICSQQKQTPNLFVAPCNICDAQLESQVSLTVTRRDVHLIPNVSST